MSDREQIGKFLTVVKLPSTERKTGLWSVFGEGEVDLGTVCWYGAWRQYIFQPTSYTVFHRGCLEDIAAFLKRVNDKHRAEVAARRQKP